MSRVGFSLDVGGDLKGDEVSDSEELKESSNGEVDVFKGVGGADGGYLEKFLSVFCRFSVPLILLFLVFVSFWSLSQTFFIPVIDERAEQQVAVNFRQLAVQQVFAKYPQATREELQRMASQALVEGKQSGKYQALVQSTIEKYKEEYRDDAGVTYLYTPDSFYYFRLARNLLENGHLGSELKNNESFDALRFAPDGDWPSFSVMPYALFYFYKVWSLWDEDISLEYTTFFFSVLIGILSVCTVFLIGWKIDGLLTGIFAGFVLAVHPLFVLFNYGGYSDTQVLVFFLSSLLVLLLLFVLDFSRLIRALCVLPLFLFVLYLLRRSWSGWFFMLVIFVLALVVWVGLWLIHHAVKKRDWWQYVLLLVLLFFTLYGSFWFSRSLFFEQALERLSVDSAVESVFPTAFESVLELQGIDSLKRFVDVLGGPLLVVVFFGQLVVLCYSAIRKVPKFSFILLLSWTVLLMVSGVRALRFMYLVLPAFVLFTGVGFSNVVRWLPDFFNKFHAGKNERFVRITGVFLVFLLVFLFVREDVLTQKTSFPAGYDSIYEAGEWLQKNSAPDAIIASWWDLGYVWQVASRRATLFDGGLFNTFYLYWVSKLLLTDDSGLARGVLQTIGCDDRFFISEVPAVDHAAEEAVIRSDFLKAGVSDIFYDKRFWDYNLGTIERTHCQEPREVFFAVDQDMLYKLGLYELYSGWDLDVSRYSREVRNLSRVGGVDYLERAYNLSEREAEDMLSRIELQNLEAVVPVKMSKLGRCASSGEVVRCDNDFRINLSVMDARMNGAHPGGLVVVNDGERLERLYNDSRADYSVVLFNTSDGWHSLLMDAEVSRSLVVRMFVREDIPFFERVFVSGEMPNRVVLYKAVFRNESFEKNVDFSVPLSPLSGRLFFKTLLINFSDGNYDFFFDVFEKCSVFNFSGVDISKENLFYRASRNATCSVQEFIDELKEKKRILLTLEAPLADNADFFSDYFRSAVVNDVSAMIGALQVFIDKKLIPDFDLDMLQSKHGISEIIAITTSNTNITAKMFVNELKKVIGRV